MSANHQPIVYLDNNATTQVDPAVFDAMVPWLRDDYGNPSSVYSLGKHAAAAIDIARAQVASLIDCASEEIIFTSCGSESINSAILSAASIDPDKTHIVTTAVEHSATIKLCEHLARRGYEITWLPVDNLGRLDLEKLERAIRADTALVTLLWANNETGVLFPIEEIVRITNRQKGCLARGCRPSRRQASSQRQRSRDPVPLPLRPQAPLPERYRSPLCQRASALHSLVARQPGKRSSRRHAKCCLHRRLGKAAELAAAHLGRILAGPTLLRDRFEKAILEAVPGAEVNGDRENRLPNTTNIAFEGIESEGALMLLDERGICCSAGSACTSGSVHPSHVLKAMGFSNHRARSSLRFSFGRFNTDDQVVFAAHGTGSH